MKDRIIKVLVFMTLIASGILMGCRSSYQVYGKRDPTDSSFKGIIVQQDSGSPKKGCLPVPEGLTEQDLVGVWGREAGTHVLTTLILKEDGTYRQSYHDPDTGYRYESSGLDKWWVEKREIGIWRLHLEGMKMCDNSLHSDCAKYGDQARRGLWFDPCEGESLDLSKGVILLVLGADPQSPFGELPKGIHLRYPIKDPDTPTGGFQLQK